LQIKLPLEENAVLHQPKLKELFSIFAADLAFHFEGKKYVNLFIFSHSQNEKFNMNHLELLSNSTNFPKSLPKSPMVFTNRSQ